MKQIALEDAQVRTVHTTMTAPSEQTPGPPTMYAGVADRDVHGAPSRLALPGSLAAGRCGLYVGGAWVGDVSPDGTIERDRDRAHLLTSIVPGTRIVASTDSAGRLLALTALARVPASGKPHRRAAAPSPVHSRTADRYAHNPREVLHSGQAGRVLRVL